MVSVMSNLEAMNSLSVCTTPLSPPSLLDLLPFLSLNLPWISSAHLDCLSKRLLHGFTEAREIVAAFTLKNDPQLQLTCLFNPGLIISRVTNFYSVSFRNMSESQVGRVFRKPS